jgi:hypothetical protein
MFINKLFPKTCNYFLPSYTAKSNDFKNKSTLNGGFHGDGYDECHVLGCDAVWLP